MSRRLFDPPSGDQSFDSHVRILLRAFTRKLQTKQIAENLRLCDGHSIASRWVAAELALFA